MRKKRYRVVEGTSKSVLKGMLELFSAYDYISPWFLFNYPGFCFFKVMNESLHLSTGVGVVLT